MIIAFTHHCNILMDNRLNSLRMELGWEGYGLYWALIEHLASNDNKIRLDYDYLAKIFNTKKILLTQIIEDYNLFSLCDEKDFFYAYYLAPTECAAQTTKTNAPKENKTPVKRFVPPTIEECRKYAIEHGYDVQIVDAFYYYYESNGWKVGKNPMKKWNMALARWNADNKNKILTTQQKREYEDYTRRQNNIALTEHIRNTSDNEHNEALSDLFGIDTDL